MSIKTTFRSFTSAVFLLKKTTEIATKARVENYENKTITTKLDIDQVLSASMAQPAFLAFSIELGLKTLLVESETIKEPRGHRLKELFDKLPDNIKDTIQQDVTSRVKNINFEELLEENSENFIKWRYFHETNTLSSNGEFLGNFLVSIHNYSVNINTKK